MVSPTTVVSRRSRAESPAPLSKPVSDDDVNKNASESVEDTHLPSIEKALDASTLAIGSGQAPDSPTLAIGSGQAVSRYAAAKGHFLALCGRRAAAFAILPFILSGAIYCISVKYEPEGVDTWLAKARDALVEVTLDVALAMVFAVGSVGGLCFSAFCGRLKIVFAILALIFCSSLFFYISVEIEPKHVIGWLGEARDALVQVPNYVAIATMLAVALVAALCYFAKPFVTRRLQSNQEVCKKAV